MKARNRNIYEVITSPTTFLIERLIDLGNSFGPGVRAEYELVKMELNSRFALIDAKAKEDHENDNREYHKAKQT